MGHADFHVRNQPVQDILNSRKFFHFVVQEKQLTATIEFIVDDALDFLLIEKDNFRLDGNTVGRRSLDNGKVPCTEQRELQGTRNGGCRKG